MFGGTTMTDEIKKITQDMSLVDVIKTFPQTIAVFQEFGLGCLGCAAAQFETLQQGALVHGMDAAKLVEALNKAIE